MRLLVIGASGLVGKAVYQMSREHGWHTVGTSTHGDAELRKFDLLEDTPERLGRYIPLDKETSVVIAAAKTQIDYCAVHTKDAYAINVVAMKKLLLWLAKLGVRALFYSSDAVFDGLTGGYTEISPTAPLSEYGKQKVEMEEWLQCKLPSVLIYRLPKLADSSLRGRHLFSDLYQQYSSGQEIRCIEGLMFNPTALSDIATCSLLGLKQGLYGMYNVANDERFTREQIAKLFFKDRPCKISSLPISEWNFKEPKALNTTLSTEKFRQRINFQFKSMQDLATEFWSNL